MPTCANTSFQMLLRSDAQMMEDRRNGHNSIVDVEDDMDDMDEELWFSQGSKYSLGGLVGFDFNREQRYYGGDRVRHGSTLCIDNASANIPPTLNRGISKGMDFIHTDDNDQEEQYFPLNDLVKLMQRLQDMEADSSKQQYGIDKAEEELQAELRKIGGKDILIQYIKEAKRQFGTSKEQFKRELVTTIKQGDVRSVSIAVAGIKLSRTKVDKVLIKGYSILHFALLYQKTKIVQMLLEDGYKEVANYIFPIHIPVQHCDIESLSYFLKENKDLQTKRDLLNTNIENTKVTGKPYASLFLAALVWGFDETKYTREKLVNIVKLMVSRGLQLDNDDEDGNTFLHLLVRQPSDIDSKIHSSEYFRYILNQVFYTAVDNWDKRNEIFKGSTPDAIRYLLSWENSNGLNPVAVAAQVESCLYSDIVKWENITWMPDPQMSIRFGGKGRYNVNAMMSFTAAGKYSLGSVMHILSHMVLNLEKPVHLEDPLSIDPMKTIIYVKWRSYRWLYWFWGLLHFLHMTAFTYCGLYVNNRNGTTVSHPMLYNSKNNYNVTLDGTKENGYILYEWLFLILPVVYLIMEIVDQCVTCSAYDSFGAYLASATRWSNVTSNFMYRIVLFGFSLLMILWFVFKTNQLGDLDNILSIVLLVGWCCMLFFVRCATVPKMTGNFAIMMQKMLLHDFIPFAIISSIFLLAFSTAIHATILGSAKESAESYMGHLEFTLFEMLKFFTAMDDSQGYEPARSPNLAKILLCMFGLFSAVLLVNVLIAAMNKTYNMISATHIDLIAQQKLAIMLLLERRMPFACVRNQSEKRTYFKKYFTETAQDGVQIVQRDVWMTCVDDKLIISDY